MDFENGLVKVVPFLACRRTGGKMFSCARS